MRHLGAHKDCKEVCGIRAAVSITGAFDIRAQCVTLKKRIFGIYDSYILGSLQDTFSKTKFKATSHDLDLYREKCKAACSLTEFDTLVRGPIFGYKGSSRLFRHISCDAFVASIETPTLAVTSKDDTITDFKYVPIDDMRRNPNITLAILEQGGHCNLWFQEPTSHSEKSENGSKGEHKELAPVLAMEFFNQAHNFYSQ